MGDPKVKKPEDLTPTEQFILTYGTPAQKDSLGFQLEDPNKPVMGVIGQPPPPSTYDRFRDAMKPANEKFRQWRADHPAGNYAVEKIPDAIAAGIDPVGGPVALKAFRNAFPGQPLPPPSGTGGSKAPEPMLPKEGQPWTGGLPAAGENKGTSWGTSIDELPDAQANVSGGAAEKPRTGIGSDSELQNAQQDLIQGKQGLVNKKLEEGGATVQYLQRESDAEKQAGFMRNLFAEAQKKADDETQNEQKDYEQKVSDAREQAAKMGVDPGRLFRGRETQSAIVLAIGGAISGIFQAMNHLPNNPFVDTVRGIVQQDIDTQDKEIAQAWKKVSGMETTYQNLVKRGVDKRVAQSTYYGQILDANMTQLKAALMAAKIPAEKANIEASIQALQNERSALDVNMQEYWKNIYEKRQQAHAAAAAAAAERLWRHNLEFQKLGIERYNARTNRMEAEGKLGASTGQSQKDLNGAFFAQSLLSDEKGNPVQVGVLAASPENRGKLEDAARAHETTKKAIAEIRRLRGDGPEREGENRPAGGWLGRAGSASTPLKHGWERGVDSEASALKASLNKGAGLGAYDNGTAKLLEARVGDLKSVGAAGDHLVDQLEKQAERDYQAYLNANGGRPAARVYDPQQGRWVVTEIPGEPRAPAGDGVKGIPGVRQVK